MMEDLPSRGLSSGSQSYSGQLCHSQYPTRVRCSEQVSGLLVQVSWPRTLLSDGWGKPCLRHTLN